MEDKILNIYTSIADEVAVDEKVSAEYLREEGIDFEKLYNQSMKSVAQLISNHKMSLGSINAEKLSKKFKEFEMFIQYKSVTQVIEIYPSLAKTAYSKLERKELTPGEIDNLLLDGSFLSFLETFNIPDDTNSNDTE